MSIKELKQLLRLLRAEGVTDYKTPELELKLGELTQKDTEIVKEEVDTAFPDRVLSNEELMYYSSGGTQGLAPPEETVNEN